MARRKIDYMPVLAMLGATRTQRRQVAVPEQTLEHWRYLEDVSLGEALEAVSVALVRYPDVSPQSIYEPAGFWSVGVFAKYFCEEFVGDAFGTQHETFFSLFRRGERDRHLNILAPRGSGKSTCVARIYPLHCCFFHDTYVELGMPTDNFILIISFREQQARDHIVAIRDKIEGDARFAHLEGRREWGAMGLRTAQGVWLTPVSVGVNARGMLKGTYRPTLVLKDDVDATDTVTNPDQRQKAIDWHKNQLENIGVPRFTNFVSIDTLKHPESIASMLRTQPNVRTTHLRAIPNPPDLWHPTHEDLWVEWSKIYSDMSIDDDLRILRSDAYFEQHRDLMMEGVEELWPERLPYLEVRKNIVSRGYPYVMQELQNDISSSDEFIFDMEQASRFKVSRDGFLRNDNVLVRWDEMAGATVFLDWAGTKSDSKKNCYACVVAVVWVPQPGGSELKISHLASCHAYVFAAWISRGTGATQYTALLDIFDEVRGLLLSKVTAHVPKFFCVQEGFIDKTGFVEPGARHMFESVLQERPFKDVPLHFLSRAGAEEKHTRIRLLQAPFKYHWMHFNEVLPAEFERQLSLFPTADFDDGPDALEGACHHDFRISTIEKPYPYQRGSAEDVAIRQAKARRRKVSL